MNDGIYIIVDSEWFAWGLFASPYCELGLYELGSGGVLVVL